MLTSVKFCGLCRPGDAASALAAGARYGGVILSPVGPRAQDPGTAAAIWAEATGLVRVGVFVDEPVERTRSLAESLGLGVVQLHGSERRDLARAVRAGAGWRVWKAIRPRDGAEFLAGLQAWSDVVDGLLLDGWSPSGAGGTGARVPWRAIEPHRANVPPTLELIVAGGLDPGNVGDAVRRLRPGVVDVSSGVETERCVKSGSLMRRFVAAVRAAEGQAEE